MKKFTCALPASLRICAIAATLTLAGCMDNTIPTDSLQEVSAPQASDTLTISGEPPTEAIANSTYFFQPSVDTAENTGSGDVSYSIQNQPQWLSFDAATGALSGTPGDAQIGVTTEITITAQAKSSIKSGTVGPFRITVKPSATGTAATANAAPTISGTPATQVGVSQAYTFAPTASDPEGATLSFSIANRPSWATFETATGKLIGTPQTANVGKYSNIIVRVSNGSSSVSLPAFSINVVAVTVAMTAVNIAPTISGTPSTTVTTDSAYSFTPSASDVNSDALTFSVQNMPAWASFNAATGQLYGTPTSAGTSANIVISVSDGKTSTALSAFSITAANAVVAAATGSALLSWTAPTVNTDGSALTDLAGFHVYAGKDPSSLTRRADVAGNSTVQYQAKGLDTGTWYFSISAYNSSGVESAQPAAVSTSIS